MTLNLDDLERVVNLSGAHVKDHLVWPRAEIAALIARLREAEQERDEARWAAGIVGDVARESSGGWQDAAAELHATQARLREAEAVIANVEDFVTRHYLDMRMGQAVLALTDAYKPTNQEGS